jgi:PIN domain-containing protein
VPRGVQPPPEFLIDRSLGVELAEAIRARGYVVHTLRSIYGEERAQEVPDEVWIREASLLGRIQLTKDDSIRRYPPAREAARASGAKIFCLPGGHMTTAEMRQRYLINLNRIVQRARKDGPYMYAVDPAKLRLLWPRDPAKDPSGVPRRPRY